MNRTDGDCGGSAPSPEVPTLENASLRIALGGGACGLASSVDLTSGRDFAASGPSPLYTLLLSSDRGAVQELSSCDARAVELATPTPGSLGLSFRGHPELDITVPARGVVPLEEGRASGACAGG